MSDPTDFIGRGFSFPMRVDQSGSLAMTAGSDDINSSIRMVLTTAPGERLMRPEFGCRIWELLFEPINANTLGLMSEAVREAVTLEDVRLEPAVGSTGEVKIHLDYRIRATNDQRNLVYPFYVIPREDES
jgi:phage baseplate assembly protein W